jgi:hypothetical protein
MKRRDRHSIGRAATIGFAAVLALAGALTGCGSGQSAGVSASDGPAPTSLSTFMWLSPGPAATEWSVVRLRSGAALARPPGWRSVHTDPGTASFALLDRHRVIVAYLNATPRQGSETLANWASFRVHHNADEGSRNVRTLAAARGLRFRSGPGSCVIDQYRTSARSYREIACLVAGRGRATVIVGAATAALWSRQAPVIERAVSTFIG